MIDSLPIKERKPGRPRAIPAHVEPVVVKLYAKGYGYRSIANIHRNSEYGLNPHFCSIRQTLIRLGIVQSNKRSPDQTE
jgi:hypothetical protein